MFFSILDNLGSTVFIAGTLIAGCFQTKFDLLHDALAKNYSLFPLGFVIALHYKTSSKDLTAPLSSRIHILY